MGIDVKRHAPKESKEFTAHSMLEAACPPVSEASPPVQGTFGTELNTGPVARERVEIQRNS